MTEDASSRLAGIRVVVFPLAVSILILALSLYESTFHKVGRDQGGWTYTGWVWEAYGMAPYSGTMDNKTPGIHMLYAIFVRYFGIGIWPHAVTSAAALVVTALLVYSLARRLYDRTAGELAMLLFALTMTMPSLDGALYVEPFVVLFSTAAFYLVLTPRDVNIPRGNRRLLLAGACIGGAIFFKQTAIFDALALCISIAALDRQRTGSLAGAARSVTIVILGIALATILTLIPLLTGGTTLHQYWEGGWLLLLKPGTAAKLTNRIYNFVLVWGGMKTKMPLFYPLVLLFVLQRRWLSSLAVPCGCLLAWLGLEFVGVNASGQLWGHQVQEIVPVLAVISGIGASAAIQAIFADERRRRLCTWWALATACVLWAPIDLFDATCLRIYFRSKGEAASIDKPQALGLWLKEHVPGGKSTFVWSPDAGRIYAYAEKIAPTRYFHNHFAGNADAMAEVQEALRQRPPLYVVIQKDPYPAAPAWLQEWIAQNYKPRDEQYEYVILKRAKQK